MIRHFLSEQSLGERPFDKPGAVGRAMISQACPPPTPLMLSLLKHLVAAMRP